MVGGSGCLLEGCAPAGVVTMLWVSLKGLASTPFPSPHFRTTAQGVTELHVQPRFETAFSRCSFLDPS